MPAVLRILAAVCLCGPIALGTSGCALLDASGVAGLFNRPTERTAAKLPPIPAPRHGVEIEVIFVERPAGDPLLGDVLWRDVDNVGSLDAATRGLLDENGIRFGMVGSEPPPALQQMLGLTAQSGSEDRHRLVGRRIVLSSGGGAEIQAGALFPECRVSLAERGKVETREFENARFVYRITARRDQDGWAQLDFVPEIHYGAMQLRRTATETGWQLQTRQEILPLYSQRFSVNLNTGEMALLTADDSATADASLGRHFFRGTGDNANIQRLLLVRLSRMTKANPVYATE